MTEEQPEQTAGTAYTVVAYRNRRAYLLDHRDYSKRVATREDAERAREQLIEEARRSRIGWQYIDIRPDGPRSGG